MKNKGFTIVELMAIIVILGILSTIAIVGVSRYRKEVRDKELIQLHSTIEAAYDTYRQGQMGKYKKNITINSTSSEAYNSYFEELSFNGQRLSLKDIDGSKFNLKIKGNLLNEDKYKTDRQADDDKIADGTCLVTTTVENNNIIKSCQTNNGDIEPSKEELLCIILKVNDEEVINDYNNSNSLCRYFTK